MRITCCPKFQAFDDNGNPLSYGKLYTYKAGTTTAKATYTSSVGDTPNANPVILDSRGEATVFGNGRYKYVLKTSAGVTVWTVDGIGGSDYNNISYADDDLEAAITAAGSTQTTLLVDQPVALTGNLTVPANVALWIEKNGVITIPDTFKLTINGPFDCGLWQCFSDLNTDYDGIVFGPIAVKEVYPEWWVVNTTPGTTDMSGAIQSAINSLTLGTIEGNNATYAIGSNIVIDDYKTLQNATIKLKTITPSIYLTGINPALKNVTVNTVGDYSYAAILEDTTGAVVDGLQVHDVYLAWGVLCQTKALDTTIKNCTFGDICFGVIFDDMHARTGLGGTYTGSIGSGLRIENCTFGTYPKTLICDGFQLNFPTSGFTDVEIVNCRVYGTKTSGGNGLGICLANVQDFKIDNCWVQNCQLDGIHVEDRSAFGVVSNNRADDCYRSYGFSDLNTVDIMNNKSFDPTAAHLVHYNFNVAALPSDINIYDNVFKNGAITTDYCFIIDGAVTNINIVNNTFKDVLVGAATRALILLQDGTYGGITYSTVRGNKLIKGTGTDTYTIRIYGANSVNNDVRGNIIAGFSAANMPWNWIDATTNYLEAGARVIGQSLTALPGVSADQGDTAPTYYATTSSRTVVFASALTQARAPILSMTLAYDGAQITIVRSGGSTGGPWNLTMTCSVAGALKAMPGASWATFMCNGTNWVLTGYGAL